MILRSILLACLLSFPLTAAHAAKAMNCAECKEAFGQGPACTPICVKPSKGKKAQNLYSAVQSLGISNCTGSSCFANLNSLDCNWSNSPDSRRVSCSYQGSDKKQGSVEGAKARRLAKAMEATGEVVISCGAGSCGFRNALDVNCEEQRKSRKPKMILAYECRVMNAAEVAAPVADPESDTFMPVLPILDPAGSSAQ
jgi:hypothetical protein